MTLDKALKNMKYDTRLVEWHIKNNQLSKEELEKHLQQLPDCGGNIDLISFSKEESEENEH